MNMGNLVVNHEKLEDDVICPHCNAKECGMVVEDWTSVHSREILIECADCHNLYKAIYKFEKIVKLVEEPFDYKLPVVKEKK